MADELYRMHHARKYQLGWCNVSRHVQGHQVVHVYFDGGGVLLQTGTFAHSRVAFGTKSIRDGVLASKVPS